MVQVRKPRICRGRLERRSRMITDKEAIKTFLAVCSKDEIIDVLFEEEIINVISDKALVKHLVDALDETTVINLTLDIYDNDRHDKKTILESVADGLYCTITDNE